MKTWKRRWFILTDNCLYYFEYTTDKEPRGIIPLENLSIRELEDSKKPVSVGARPLGGQRDGRGSALQKSEIAKVYFKTPLESTTRF